MAYNKTVRSRSFNKSFRYRARLSNDNAKYTNVLIDDLLSAARRSLEQVREDRQFQTAGTDWQTPTGSTKSYKTWMEVLNSYIHENCHISNSPRELVRSRYFLLKMVSDALDLFGLDVCLRTASPGLRNCSFHVFPRESSLKAAIDKKFHDLWRKNVQVSPGNTNIRLFDIDSDDDFEAGVRLAHKIVRLQRFGISTERDDKPAWPYNWSLSHPPNLTWYKILQELQILHPDQFDIPDDNQRKEEKSILRQVLFDFDLAIVCQKANANRNLTASGKAKSKFNNITFTFLRQPDGFYDKLPALKDFGLNVPPVTHFYDVKQREYIKAKDAVRRHRLMLDEFVQENKRIETLEQKEFEDYWTKRI